VGLYVGQILKGAKPADLPFPAVDQAGTGDQFRTPKALGLTVPMIMQMAADDVIELAVPASSTRLLLHCQHVPPHPGQKYCRRRGVRFFFWNR
jgi:hypothetical protein